VKPEQGHIQELTKISPLEQKQNSLSLGMTMITLQRLVENSTTLVAKEGERDVKSKRKEPEQD
jgi:hypothetical protein